jgi:hypothetical protein
MIAYIGLGIAVVGFVGMIYATIQAQKDLTSRVDRIENKMDTFMTRVIDILDYRMRNKQ